MDKQIFQTDNQSRWKRFKWTIGVILFIVALFVAAFFIMLAIERLPTVPFKQSYRKVVTAEKPLLQETKLSKEYKEF